MYCGLEQIFLLYEYSLKHPIDVFACSEKINTVTVHFPSLQCEAGLSLF